MRRDVLFVTNHVPPDRVGAFWALHERVGIELALFGGRSTHATEGVADPGVPHRHVTEKEVHALAASGRYRAVVAGTAGRTALPAAWLGARRGRVPFVLWSALWAHPRTAAHLPGAALMHAIYRTADAVVVYGPHVGEFVRARGARRVVVAPQAVDGGFWAQPVAAHPPAPFTAAFVGRDAREKGLWVLEAAWRALGLDASVAALVLVGVGSARPGVGGAVNAVGVQPPEQVRNFLGAAHVLVVPSVRSRRFREPWGLVVNEAMHRALPVIASTEVGAAAGGLVRDERNGLIVPAGDAGALAAALARLQQDPALGVRLGAQGREDVAAYTFAAWAEGFAEVLGERGAVA